MGHKAPPHDKLARAADNMALLCCCCCRCGGGTPVVTWLFSITAEQQEGIKEGGAVETRSTFYSGKVNS